MRGVLKQISRGVYASLRERDSGRSNPLTQQACVFRLNLGLKNTPKVRSGLLRYARNDGLFALFVCLVKNFKMTISTCQISLFIFAKFQKI